MKSYPKILLKLDVLDKDKKIRSIEKEDPPTGNLKKILALNFYKEANLGYIITDTVYTTKNIVNEAGEECSMIANWNYSPASFGLGGASNVKIALGNGTKPFDLNDYALESKIAEMTPTRQMILSPTTNDFHIVYGIVWTAPVQTTISEIGLFMVFRVYNTVRARWENNWIMIARDLIYPPITLSPEQSIAIEYRIIV